MFARLAEHSIGLVDWNSYLPLMFARIQKMFHLPVVFNKGWKLSEIISTVYFLNSSLNDKRK